jgi:hypothetical protein
LHAESQPKQPWRSRSAAVSSGHWCHQDRPLTFDNPLHHPRASIVPAASTKLPRFIQKSWLLVRYFAWGYWRGRHMPSNHLQIHPPAAGYLSTAFVMACLPPLLDRMASNVGFYAVAAWALTLPTNHQPKRQ